LQFELRPPLPYNQRMSDGANDSINASTRVCGVFGHPVRHSASPAMQNAAIAALKLNWHYLAFDVHPDNLRAAIEGAKAMRFIGLNLTVPHKIKALNIVDVVDDRARLFGAINTVVFETRDSRGNWVPLAKVGDDINEVRSHGYNTDADAILRSILEEFKWLDLHGATILLLGAGGGGRATALRLAEAKISKIFIVARTEKAAKQLALRIKRCFPHVEAKLGYPNHAVDLVINGTPLGLKRNDHLPVDLRWLRLCPPRRVYDLVYRPKETALMRAAKAVGSKTANGLGMLLYQGAAALKLWSGVPPPIPIMRAALEKNLHD
jgi:shikimate dehydrogenase